MFRFMLMVVSAPALFVATAAFLGVVVFPLLADTPVIAQNPALSSGPALPTDDSAEALPETQGVTTGVPAPEPVVTVSGVEGMFSVMAADQSVTASAQTKGGPRGAVQSSVQSGAAALSGCWQPCWGPGNPLVYSPYFDNASDWTAWVNGNDSYGHYLIP